MDAADAKRVEDETAEHLAVAELAIRHGYCTFEEVGRLLLDLPQLMRPPMEWAPKRIWVDAGPLDETEWMSIRVTLQERQAQSSPPEDAPSSDPDLATNPQQHHEPSAAESSVRRDRSSRSGMRRTNTTRVVSDEEERYVVGKELGRGGGGLVVRAFDSELQRVVAMKLPLPNSPTRNPQNLRTEANTTSRLEHPNVVPVYDAGLLPCGTRYYTMRRVTGLSLRDVIRGLKNNDVKTAQRWPLLELLRAIIEITHAIEYAHHRGILHRDLKPENIMLGEFGEVYVMDWGLASSETSEGLAHPKDPNRLETLGTPAYMSPEQATGSRHLTPQSDIYSIGVIIYELLTYIVPSRRGSVVETLLAVSSEPIIPPSMAVETELDMELDEIVMRALRRRPRDRYASVRDLRKELQVYVSGKRPHTAKKRLEEALVYIEVYDQGVERIRKLRAKAQRLAAPLRPSDAFQDKRSYWRAAERLEQVEKENVLILEQAMDMLNTALNLDPDLVAAQTAIADLAWRKHKESVEAADDRNFGFSRALLRQYDRTGEYTRLLDAPTSLHIEGDADDIDVFIQLVEVSDRRLRLGQLRHLGALPLQVPTLPRGSWHLTFKRPGVPAVHLPVLARANDPLNVRVSMENAQTLPRGFAIVPHGHSIVGGDPYALDPLPRQARTIATFAAQFRHVLLAEYLEWIRHLALEDPSFADSRIPVLRSGRPLIRQAYDDSYEICGNAIRELDPDALVTDELPVVGIRSADIEEYIHWRSGLDGIAYRLPTELEYERMARGADGRIFPWGDRFDPAFCTMLLSSPCQPRLLTIGRALSDIGPFGQRDLAGNVRELCTIFNRDGYVACGGSWQTDERACRAASRSVLDAGQRQDDVGFRLVFEP